jgi:tripartite-type tricarboxylate transporter receptor subunit TctC
MTLTDFCDPRAMKTARLRRPWRRAATLASGLMACAMSVVAPPALAQADAWPTQTLKLIVPFPPGGAADIIGRHYAEQLSHALGKPVVVDNKPGAGTAIAAEAAARATDGHTLSLATSGQLTILPNLQSNLRFNPLKDFAAVSVVASVPNVVAVNPDLKVNTLAELTAAAKARPGKIGYSSCGTGTLCHLTGELYKNLVGADLLHVPYKGSAPAVAAVLGGEVGVAVDTLTILAPQIKAGKLKGLALTSTKRSPLLPDVPSAAEAGLPDFVVSGWFGIVLPANAPPTVVERLNREIAVIAQSQKTAQHFAQNGITVEQSSPAAFAKLIRDDHARWGQVIRVSEVKLD